MRSQRIGLRRRFCLQFSHASWAHVRLSKGAPCKGTAENLASPGPQMSTSLEAVQASPELAKGGGLSSKLVEASNGLYTARPTSCFEIRIEDEDFLCGRDIFSREYYHPGTV